MIDLLTCPNLHASSGRGAVIAPLRGIMPTAIVGFTLRDRHPGARLEFQRHHAGA